MLHIEEEWRPISYYVTKGTSFYKVKEELEKLLLADKVITLFNDIQYPEDIVRSTPKDFFSVIHKIMVELPEFLTDFNTLARRIGIICGFDEPAALESFTTVIINYLYRKNYIIYNSDNTYRVNYIRYCLDYK